MSPQVLAKLITALQEAALPAVWQKGVNASKDATILEETRSEEEILLKFRKTGASVSPKITLWPKELDWHCDCGDRNDPCVHVIASSLALKNGTVKNALEVEKPVRESRKKKKTDDDAPETTIPRLEYRFYKHTGCLYFDRYFRMGKKELKLTQSLVAFMGGLQNGRIKDIPAPALTKEDFAIDQILGGQGQNPLDRYTLTRLLAALKGNPAVSYEEKPIEISAQTASMQARLIDDKDGFRLEWVNDPSVSIAFKNGAVLSGGALKAIRDPLLSTKEKESFRHISPREIQTFVSEILPSLEAKMIVRVETKRIPRLRKIEPRVVLHCQAETKERLSVFPMLVYGDPPLAELVGSELRSLSDTEIPERDFEGENALIKKLHNDLQLQIGRQSIFENESALNIASKLRGWDTSGNGLSQFTVDGALEPKVEVGEGAFDLKFQIQGGGLAKVSAKDVLKTWQENKSFVKLEGGGWASLPHDWLFKYAERVAALLAVKESRQKVPNYLLPEATAIAEESGQKISDRLQKLKETLQNFEKIPHASLPKGLKASLRLYQKRGFDWLCFLKTLEMGALLADDMGLGKTLQTIATLSGRCLIVCPTSVLQSWSDQLKEFRPDLDFCVYHGSSRSMSADIVLTSYGVFRMEHEKLTEILWDTVVLDEAQVIKNPDSQIAKACHKLNGNFKIALSGTPVENKLDDLWSQFHFLNPGLLGSRDEFNEHYGEAIRNGNQRKLEKLRSKIKPFLLRRLKKDVAPELPPRTEIVLHCDLNDEENALYNSILAASKNEVMEKLETGNVFAALEMLLRLRQSCCHPALVPGSGKTGGASSSKMELFFEQLEESLDQGHRALVFSQWTSLLDILEPKLKEKNIRFSRLDGSTRDRERVVNEFQKEDGPSIMLVSLKAGGVGITLTAADHIYILDPWWNPAAEDQAADRAHRIGQENPVFIHRLVARGTVEDKILQLQKSKRALAGSLLEGAASATQLTREDILGLLN